MTDDELKAIEARLAGFQHTEFSGGTRNFLRGDVPQLVAEVRRQAAELRAWREWVNDEFGARLDPDDPDVPNTDESLRSLASAINNE
jgi:hypothetical protein